MSEKMGNNLGKENYRILTDVKMMEGAVLELTESAREYMKKVRGSYKWWSCESLEVIYIFIRKGNTTF